MGLREAENGMLSLEHAAVFDEKKVGVYVAKIREYLEKKRSRFGDEGPSLIDVTDGTVELPVHLQQRIGLWMHDREDNSPFMKTFAKYYLQSLIIDSDIYLSLAECVIEGGDFYIENGIFFVRDLARVSSVS